MKKVSLIFLCAFLLGGCSFPTTFKGEAVKSNDELEFAVDTVAEIDPTEIKVEEQKIEEVINPDEVSSLPPESMAPTEEFGQALNSPSTEKEKDLVPPEEPTFKDFLKESPAPEVTAATNPEELGQEAQYNVAKGDTLMMIAFKIYGDYRKWKDLKAWNKDVLKSKMSAGMALKYFAPKESFSWQPSGLPYLVKTGDTLQIVSLDKYGTPKKWKRIYENNRPLIRDPNFIFAGFTIYYVPERDIASERK